MEQINPHLEQFITTYCKRYKVNTIDCEHINANTSIDLDLDIVDIETELFLAEFAEHFKIDKTKFSWYKYGYPKGSARVRFIRYLFGYQHPWVKKLSAHCYKPKLKVAVLQEALQTGKLI